MTLLLTSRPWSASRDRLSASRVGSWVGPYILNEKGARMDALIEKTGDVVVIHLRGRLDYETVTPFRNHCVKHLVKEKVIFNLSQLSFVGSIGLTDFLQTVTQLSVATPFGIKFAAVSNEFRRLFEASEIQRLEIYENTERALMAYQGLAVSPMPRLSPAEIEPESPETI